MDKETLSNYGWIVICVLVLAVMIALATPFGNYVKTGVESTRDGLIETGNKGIEVAKLATGTPNNNGGNEPSAPTVRNDIIPDDATYTPKGETAITGNGTNTFPDTPATGDTYEEGDYRYTYNRGNDYGSDWSVKVKDTSKITYGEILSEIAGQPVTSMYNTFSGCYSLTTAPIIPNSVTNMRYTFRDCTSLKTYVGSTDTDGGFSNYTIPNSVTNMVGTFYNCTKLTTAPAIPNSVTNMGNTFLGCTSLTTAPTIPNSVTNMSYTFFKCTSLTTAPDMSNANSVTNMFGTFQVCTSLTTTPVIPNSITNMESTFDGCAALTTAPTIPSGVWNMSYTFRGCASLTTAPVIPSGVTNVFQTFNGCTSLTGSIEVNGNIDISNTYNYGMFIKNSQITEITGSCSNRIKSLLLRTKTEDYPW